MVTTDLDHMVLQASLCSGEPTDQHQAIAGAFSFISFLLKIFGLEVESLKIEILNYVQIWSGAWIR